MPWEAWLTLAVVVLCVGLLASNRYPPDTIMLGGLTLLLLSGILTPAEALSGLSNEGMVTVAVLYVVVSGLQETGGTAWVSQSLLGRPRSVAQAQLRLMAPVAALSAFLNNTPVVAMFIPAVQDWAKRHGISASKLMLPLSYAAIAGGTCTLIGTSTNLVDNGLLIEQPGLSGLGMFEIAWVGLPALLLVIVFTMMFGRRLLPDRRSILSQLEDAREYTVEMLVEADSSLEGKTIEQAGLRQLPGMYLVELDRDGQMMPAVSPEQVLRGGDRLLFAGVVDSVLDLQKIRGLTPATDQVFKLQSPRHQRCLVEAVISESFPLLGKSIREGRFRTVYQAAIIAVARNGERIQRKIGDIVPRPGDILLMETHPNFLERYRNSRDFLLVSRLDNSSPPRHERAGYAAMILGGMVALAATGMLSLLQAAMLAAVLMFPIALAAASRLEVSVMPFAIVIMIAASASFATPIGYQTNLMVMGPGGYAFSDYLRIGLPLTLLVGVSTVLIAPLIWPF